VDRAGGFFGTDAKIGEYVCDCSDIDDVLVILRSGAYMITPVQEKRFYDKDILHIGVYNRNDDRTTYNIIYRDGRTGTSYAKRCAIGSLIRDREYNLTQGAPGSSVLYLSVNPNGEAETVFIAADVDDRVLGPLLAACREKGIVPERTATKAELGERARLDVSAAAVATLR